MKKALVPALLLVVTSVVLGATVFREQVARAAPGIQDVFVTNSTREAVPVHEQGTADVNVTNAPLAVRASGETPVQRSLEWNFFFTQQDIATYAVPVGKYLRIEQVTLDLPAGLDVRSFTVRTLAGDSEATHYLAYTPQGGSRRVVSELVSIYADPGTTVPFEVRTPATVPGTILLRGSFSGVLIDAA